ncbi:epoxide hydrolase 2 [Stemphylium lycopersici]|uniref:Epoxide hydrolase 2 n=1 Tax=Stemphylium lycopersici TaxID=183478 RepID=A0A364N050_STELY|nr:epoxide hydrolase 2 [Stemphylium lycopersici]
MESFKAGDVTLDNGETTHYYAGGSKDGTPLIFIHGWPDIAEEWKHQLSHFSAGSKYRVIAPDMRGYGDSSAPKNKEAYALEVLVPEMVELAGKLGITKAVWIGHDWGCGVTNALAAHYPELFIGLADLCVPYRSIELGLEYLKSQVNRDIYPEDEYEWGQFDYMRYYELHPEESVKAFEGHEDINMLVISSYAVARAHVLTSIKLQARSLLPIVRSIETRRETVCTLDKVARPVDADLASAACSQQLISHITYSFHDPSKWGKPSPTSRTAKDGGWFGGHPEMLPDIPLAYTCLDDSLYANLVKSKKKHGSFPAAAYYLNHTANADYAKSEKNCGVLEFPVLYIDGKYDAVCSASTTPKFAEIQRQFVKNLTYETIESGHWVHLEKPKETNDALEKWLATL